MTQPRSRILLALIGAIVGATLGLKMLVLLGFILGVNLTLNGLDRFILIFSSVWIIAFAVFGIFLVTKVSTLRTKKPTMPNEGVRDGL